MWNEQAQYDFKNKLHYFTGTESYTKHMGIILTDGAKFVAEEGKAWWLMDAIASYSFEKWFKDTYFLSIKLEVSDDDKAKLIFEDGDYNHLHTQEIEYTDFPIEEISFYAIDSEFGKKVVMLTSEY